jgi:hypothetical protein
MEWVAVRHSKQHDGGGGHVTAVDATAEVFFTAFKSLKSKEREAFLEKVLGDSVIRRDIIDIALIEESKKVAGRPVSAIDYFQKRRKS